MSQKQALWAILLAVTLMVQGCAHFPTQADAQPNADALLLPDTSTLQGSANLTPAQVSQDLELLILALTQGYGGRKFIEPAQFQTALKRLRALAEETKTPITSATLRNRIDEILLAVPDNHLHSRLEGQWSQAREQSFRHASVGENIGINSSKSWSITTRTVAGKQLPTLSIIRFPPAESDEWKGYSEALLSALRTAPAHIIDLRGNGGGSDTMGTWLAEKLYGSPPPLALEAQIKSQTPETQALAANSWRAKILSLRKRGKQVPAYLEKRLQEKMAEFALAKKGDPPPEKTLANDPVPEHPSSSRSGFDRPIAVLIDADWKYRDGRYVEKTGYAPKIQVQSGSDAMEAAVRWLASEMRHTGK